MANDKRQRKYPNLKRGGAIRQKYKQGQHPASAKNLRRGAGPGRPKGVPNKATREAKALARSILEDPAVQWKLREQAQRGKLAPAVMTMLFHYAYGKPKETVAVEGRLEALTIRIVDEYVDADPDGSGSAADAGA